MRSLLMIAIVGGLLIAPDVASAQIVGSDVTANSQASWNTASAGVMSQRAPGRLVNAGLSDYSSRHGDTIQRSLSGPTISDTAPTITLAQQTRVSVLETLFQNLNLALTALNASIGTSTGGTTTGGGTTTTTAGLVSLLGTITSPV